ncbi:MAG: hypothetical protein AAF697_07160 [Pseudomonadota bacterium]
MKFRTIALATAALSLAASPAIAQAVFDRSHAPIEGESSVDGDGTLLLAVLGGAAVIGGVVLAASGGDDEPTSP